MDDEQRRSCFICAHQDLCCLRRDVRDATHKAAWMHRGKHGLTGWITLFDTLAEACNQYQRQEEKA